MFCQHRYGNTPIGSERNQTAVEVQIDNLVKFSKKSLSTEETFPGADCHGEKTTYNHNDHKQ